MSTIAQELDVAFRAAIRAAFGIDADPLVAPAQNEKFGDYQSNAAMGLAKQLSDTAGQKTNPRAVAEQIKSRLDLGSMASEVSIAGPGFINIRLLPAFLTAQLQTISDDPRLGIDKTASPQTVVVDYSGPNVAKEMHIGHIRSTFIGDALARILEFQSHHVIRQNHLGDWGTQFGMLLAYLKTIQSSASDSSIADLDAFYKQARERFENDASFADEARTTVVRFQSGQGEERALWQHIIDESRAHFQPLYERLNVSLQPQNERGESFYNSQLADVVKELREKGVAVESQGAIVVWVEGFKAPLIIQKSDGGFGYGTTDLAALRYRSRELGARRIVYVTDTRQIQHFKQVFATARKAGWADDVRLEHVTFGTILGEDGTPFKARSGESVKLRDVVNEAEDRAFVLVSAKNPELPEPQRRNIAHAVGIGAVKYFDLNRDTTGDYVFAWEKMLAMDGNTGPYLQYAFARIKSIFRKSPTGVATSAAMSLTETYELSLAKHILRVPEILDLVARELKPHHLCSYLYDLATRFSSFYENCPVLQSDEPTRSSRLRLSAVTARTLALGLELLGIEHPEQM